MPDGKAKELNPLGETAFNKDIYYVCSILIQDEIQSKWEAAESQRKSYEVDWHASYENSEYIDIIVSMHNGDKFSYKGKEIIPGTIVEAEIIDENTVRVVKILES